MSSSSSSWRPPCCTPGPHRSCSAPCRWTAGRPRRASCHLRDRHTGRRQAQTASPAARWFETPPPAISEPGRERKMPLVSKSMPCRQRPFETASSPAWKANRRDRRRPHGPRSPTQDRTVRRLLGLRVPNLGDNREGSVGRFRELREDGCLQCRPAGSADFGIHGRGEHALTTATFRLSVISSS